MFARSSSVLALLLAAGSACAAVACQAPVDDAGESGNAVVQREDKKVLSEDANRLLDVPSYFSVSKAAADSVSIPRTEFPTLWNTSLESRGAGLRVIAIKQDISVPQILPDEPDEATATPAEMEAYYAKVRRIALPNIPAKKAARLTMSEKLAQAGILQDGDIVLTFRPENAKTVPYMHVQMGTTHASVAYIKEDASGKTAWNIDSPMKGNDYVGQFDASHFTGGVDSKNKPDVGTDALHIIRPRVMKDAKRRAQHRTWASKLASNRGGQHISFNGDYNAPSSTTREEGRKLATTIGKHALGLDAPDISIYCSEFAWHLLALSNCSEAEIRSAGPEGAQCAQDGIVFDPMHLVELDEGLGLTEGPLSAILAAPEADRAKMVDAIFLKDDSVAMSPGHKRMAAQTAGMMGPLEKYYDARVANMQFGQAERAIAARANAGMKPNYSPTAFIAQASRLAGSRPMDYIATVVFVDTDEDMAKAKRLAR